jgi:hypothetical protein
MTQDERILHIISHAGECAELVCGPLEDPCPIRGECKYYMGDRNLTKRIAIRKYLKMGHGRDEIIEYLI